ncbi:MAG: hypothetical protein VXZ32_02450 [Verrucomicrobiota bacterium]|nr:hypothetical protein [Verrucomicrobiota bacterium]
MKKILKILRNQAIDSSDQKLIDALRDESAKESLNIPDISEFKNDLITQISTTQRNQDKKQINGVQLKWIFALGFSFVIAALFFLTPQAKIRLLIPGEREKLDRQIQVWNEIKQLKDGLQFSVSEYNKNLDFDSLDGLNLEWKNNLPVYEAILSLIEIKNEVLYISPLEHLRVPRHADFEFLYEEEWNLIKEEILKLDTES